MIYDANGATSGSVPVDSIEYTNENTVAVVKGNTGNLQKTGFTFNNWNTQSDGNGVEYAPGSLLDLNDYYDDATDPDQDFILYAKWAPATLVTPTGFSATTGACST